MIVNLFNTVLTEPLFNLLVFFYNTVALGDFGIAIILLTVLIRLILWPLSQKALKAQHSLQELQPKIKSIQKKHKENKEEQAKALMDLYRENNVSPFGGCLPIIVQIPILIALYIVFLNGLDPNYLENLYSFVQNPGTINPNFIGLVDLSSRSVVLAFIAGALQFFQSKLAFGKTKLPGAPKASDEAITKMISKQTMYFLPVITVVISLRLPAGLPLYWSLTTLFTIFQQFAIISSRGKSSKNKGNNPKNPLSPRV